VSESLAAIRFDAIPGWADDDHAAALDVFRRSAARILSRGPEQRPALPADEALRAACRAGLDAADATAFFHDRFSPFRLSGEGFVTAYYEVEAEAQLTPSTDFPTPVLGRPADLVTLNDAPTTGPGGETLTGARRCADGALVPFAERAAIEAAAESGAFAPIAYVRDAVELFFMQVQGSARLRLEDGSTLALTYDGRNGWPYTSIGRLAIARGLIAPDEMSLERLKATLRRMGTEPGRPGRTLMQENRSYVFFRIDTGADRAIGPIGGAGDALTPLRSIAIDRSLWRYGSPFWISTRIPWRSDAEEEFARLMIAQDTGSAILGAARADLFFGAGPHAGHLAGRVRHGAQFTVLLPRGTAP